MVFTPVKFKNLVEHIKFKAPDSGKFQVSVKKTSSLSIQVQGPYLKILRASVPGFPGTVIGILTIIGNNKELPGLVVIGPHTRIGKGFSIIHPDRWFPILHQHVRCYRKKRSFRSII